MTRERLAGGARRALARLSEPSSAAGLAALLALVAPDLADSAPLIVEIGLIVFTAGAGLWAIARPEGNETNGQ